MSDSKEARINSDDENVSLRHTYDFFKVYRCVYEDWHKFTQNIISVNEIWVKVISFLVVDRTRERPRYSYTRLINNPLRKW